MAQNIESRHGAWQAVPHEHIVSMAPAGAAVSTAADMARYMLALLDPQQLEAAGVLKAETFAQLREPSFQSAPGMPAIHHGFFNTPLGISERLGFDNLSHAGATLHFRSFMVVTDDLRRAGERSASSSPRTARRRSAWCRRCRSRSSRNTSRRAPQAEPAVPDGRREPRAGVRRAVSRDAPLVHAVREDHQRRRRADRATKDGYAHDPARRSASCASWKSARICSARPTAT